MSRATTREVVSVCPRAMPTSISIEPQHTHKRRNKKAVCVFLVFPLNSGAVSTAGQNQPAPIFRKLSFWYGDGWRENRSQLNY